MGIKFSRYFVSASFYAHFYFYKRKEKKIDKTKFDLEDADICKDEEVFKKFELNLDEMRWEKISVMQQSTIDYWESLGYKINLEKKEEAVSNQNITYATLRVVHP